MTSTPSSGRTREVLGQGVAGGDVAFDVHELVVDRPHEAGRTGHERGPHPPFGIPRRHHRDALFLEKAAGHRRQSGADDLTHVPGVIQDPGPALDRELARMERPVGVSLSHGHDPGPLPTPIRLDAKIPRATWSLILTPSVLVRIAARGIGGQELVLRE